MIVGNFFKDPARETFLSGGTAMPAKTTAKNKRSIQAKTLSTVKAKKQIKTKNTGKAEVSAPKKKLPVSKMANPVKSLAKSGAQKSKSKSTSQAEKKAKKKPEPISKTKASSSKKETQKSTVKETQKNTARQSGSNKAKALAPKAMPVKSVSDKSAKPRISKPKETAEKKSEKTVNTKSNLAKARPASRAAKSVEEVSFERFKITNLSQVLEPSLEVLGIKPYQQKRNEEYMGVAMYDHFYRILMAHRQLLLEGGDRIVRHMQEDAVNYADPNDRASQEEDFRLELRTRDRERKLLKKIEESLELIREKEYGYCEVCGIEIGLPRLEARPTATLCIDCKTLDEIKEKQQRQDDEY